MPRKFKREPIATTKGNPNPILTETFKAHQFDAAPDVPPEVKLAKNAVCVNLPEEEDRHVREQPNKTAWLRAAVREKIARDSEVEGEIGGVSLEQLQSHINTVLLTIPPRQRKDAAKLFRKLVDYMQSELSH